MAFGRSGYIKTIILAGSFLIFVFIAFSNINFASENAFETSCWGQEDSIINHIIYCNKTNNADSEVEDTFSILFDSSLENFEIVDYKIYVLQNTGHELPCSDHSDMDGTMPNDCEWYNETDTCLIDSVPEAWCISTYDNETNSTLCTPSDEKYLICPSDNRTRFCKTVSGERNEECNYEKFNDIMKIYYWDEWIPVKNNIDEKSFSSNILSYSPKETKTFKIEWKTRILKNEKGFGSDGFWKINPEGWYYSYWGYRQNITVNGTENITGYQLKILLNSSDLEWSHISDNLSDIRFTWYNQSNCSNQEIPYWIENYTVNNNAAIWISFDLINGSSMISMYYGNSDVNSTGNLSSVFNGDIEDLAGSWNFDEGSGISHDNSGNGNDMTLSGAVYGTGRYEYSLNTSLSSDYAMSYHQSPNLTTNITIDGWVYRVSGTYLWVLSRGYDGEFEFALVPPAASNEDYRIYRGGSSPFWRMCGNITDMDNGWNHFIVVSNSTGNHFYLNGSLVCSTGPSIGSLSSDNLTIGNRADDLAYAPVARFDEVHVFNRSLTSSEISDLYSYRGYATPNYPNHLLMIKYISPEPSYSVGDEENIDTANEAQGRDSIESGIQSSLGNITVYPTGEGYQQIYTRYSDGAQNLSDFDKVVIYGNQTWAFNYATGNETFTNTASLRNIVNIWENQSLTEVQIRDQVSGFINSTKS